MTLEDKVKQYHPSNETIALVRSNPVMFLVGPTAAGKDTIKHLLLENGNYYKIITHTTRLPRENSGVMELDGREYHFIDLKTAESMLDSQQFVEAKYIHGNIYGTSTQEFLLAKQNNKTALADIDVQGVNEYKEIDKNILAIFLLPPDFETWKERLITRYGNHMSQSDYILRLETALSEIDQLLVSNNFIPIINSDMNLSLVEINNILQTKMITTDQYNKVTQSATELKHQITEELKHLN